MTWRETPSSELNGESKETKLRKKRWYVADALCVLNFSLKKIEGSRRGPCFVYTQLEMNIKYNSHNLKHYDLKHYDGSHDDGIPEANFLFRSGADAE